MKPWLTIVPGFTGIAVSIAMFIWCPGPPAICVLVGSLVWTGIGTVVYGLQGG